MSESIVDCGMIIEEWTQRSTRKPVNVECCVVVDLDGLDRTVVK